MGCSQDGVHAPPVSGISGNEHVGAWSVALSGGYEDDIDVGYAFTFTGACCHFTAGAISEPRRCTSAAFADSAHPCLPYRAALLSPLLTTLGINFLPYQEAEDATSREPRPPPRTSARRLSPPTKPSPPSTPLSSVQSRPRSLFVSSVDSRVTRASVGSYSARLNSTGR